VETLPIETPTTQPSGTRQVAKPQTSPVAKLSHLDSSYSRLNTALPTTTANPQTKKPVVNAKRQPPTQVTPTIPSHHVHMSLPESRDTFAQFGVSNPQVNVPHTLNGMYQFPAYPQHAGSSQHQPYIGHAYTPTGGPHPSQQAPVGYGSTSYHMDAPPYRMDAPPQQWQVCIVLI
jgi:hypothetical protein